MKFVSRAWISWSCGSLVALMGACASHASEAPPVLSHPAPASGTGPTDARELEAFVDNWLAENMASLGTPGVSLAFVKDDTLWLSKGYGVTDLASASPATADSVFRIASVSKVLVGMAAADAVSSGALNLDADVNDVIEAFQIPSDFDQPITLRHLMGHTSGLDDQFWGDLSLDAGKVQPLGDHLAQRTPPRVLPPGQTYSYSNYGYSLAAYLVELANEKPFHQWIGERLLQPMGMSHSGYRLQDIPTQVATGYDRNGEPQPYTYVHRYPSTSMMSSANDMTALMRTVLADGRLDDRQIYSPVTAQRLAETVYQPDPNMPGQSMGFMQWHRWGHRILWHDGEHVGFSAELVLFPQLSTGFFIVANQSGGEITSGLKYALLERYFKPADLPVIAGPYKALTDHHALAGDYFFSRRSLSSLAKILVLGSEPLSIEPQADGSVMAFGLKFAEQQPDLFAYVERPDMMFRVQRDASATPTAISLDYGGSPRSYQRLGTADDPKLHRALLVATLLCLPTLVWFYWRRRNRNAPDGVRHARMLAIALLLLQVAFALGFAVRMASVDMVAVRAAQMPELWLLLTLPLLSLLLLPVVLVLGVRSWRQSSIPDRLLYLATIGCSAMYLVQLHYWNLLGFNF